MGILVQTFPKQIFRAYDIRGHLDVFTPSVVQAIASGLAQQYQQAGQKVVALGYDARLSSPSYALLLKERLEAAGLNVIEVGCCSSPMLYFIARQFRGNGIMVTASHNAKSDNGIKWIIQGEPPCPNQIQQVCQTAQQHFNVLDFSQSELMPHQHDEAFCEQYQHALIADIQLNKTFTVVLDGLNGSAGSCAAHILEKLGCQVTALRCEPNGHFPDHAPDPSQEKHLLKLKQMVVAQKADMGIALDGDGDRLVVIDEHGQVITADRLMCLFAEMCLAEANTAASEIVFDVKCSTMVKKVIEAEHGQPVMLRTGSTFLKRYLTQSKGIAIFGGEYAGHYVFNDGRGFGYDDGLYAALRVLEYLQHKNLTLSESLEKYPNRYGTEDLYISTHGHHPQQVLAHLKTQQDQITAEICEIDGIRLDFEDGFGIIRASNTGEYFTLRFDADSLQRLNEIRDIFVSLLQDYPAIAQDILDAQ